jgi:glycosyltransferase involved in cell wall biosynthesis
MRRPRVLFISYTADWRGPTNSLLQLLTRIRDRYDVSVALTGEGAFRNELDRIGIPCFGFPDLSKWSIPGLRRLIGDREIDLVYGNNTHGSTRNAFLAAKLARRPFVCHVRGMGWDKSWSRLWYLRFCDAVIAVSDACADSVRRFVGDGRLHRVYNGVPIGDGVTEAGRSESDRGSTMPSDQDGLRNEIGASPAAPVLLGVAHLCRRKGQEHAVRAMPRVLEEAPDAHLCLAGAEDREPSYVTGLRRLVSELGVADRVHLLGYRSDVARLLAQADLFVHTATEDPHPRAVVEAMAAGLPVVAFRADGVAETVADGETGRLVDAGDDDGLADAVVSLVLAPDLRESMGDEARKRVERHFTAEATARGVSRVLDSVLERVGGHRETV